MIESVKIRDDDLRDGLVPLGVCSCLLVAKQHMWHIWIVQNLYLKSMQKP